MQSEFFDRILMPGERINPNASIASQLGEARTEEDRKFLLDFYERTGQIAPKRDGAAAELWQGVKYGGQNVLKGLASTAEELGFGSGMREAAEDWMARTQNLAPYQGYKAFSLNPTDIARTVGQSAAQTLGGVAVGGAATLATGSPAVGTAAMTAAMFGQIYGDRVKEYREIMKGVPDGQVKALALVSSVGESLIESYLGPEQAALSLFGKTAGEKAVGAAVKELVRKIGKEETMRLIGKDAAGELAKVIGKDVSEEAIGTAVKKLGQEGIESLASGMVKELAGEASRKTMGALLGQTAAKVGKEAAIGALTEGGEEVMQSYWNGLVQSLGTRKIDLPQWEQVREEFSGGAWTGFFMGGGQQMLESLMDKAAAGKHAPGASGNMVEGESAPETEDEINRQPAGSGKAPEPASETADEINRQPTGSGKAPDPAPSAGGEAAAARRALAEKVARMSGMDIVWLTPEQADAERERRETKLKESGQADEGGSSASIGGWYEYDGSRGRGTAYVNPDDPRGVDFVIGHELYHDMMLSEHGKSTGIGKSVRRIIRESVRGESEAGLNPAAQRLHDKIRRLYAEYKDGTEDFSQEFEADVWGHMFSDSEFMTDLGAELERRQDGLGRRFIEAVQEFVGRIIDAIRGDESPESSRILNEYEKTRQALASLAADYTETNAKAVNDAFQSLHDTLYAAGPMQRDAAGALRLENRRAGREKAREMAVERDRMDNERLAAELKEDEAEAAAFMEESSRRKRESDSSAEKEKEKAVSAEIDRLAHEDVQERIDKAANMRDAAAQAEDASREMLAGREGRKMRGRTKNYKDARKKAVPVPNMTHPDGSRVPDGTIYAVVDAAEGGDVVASYDGGGYDQALQNSDTGVQAKELIDRHSDNPNEELMLGSSSTSQGIPVVDPDTGDVIVHNTGVMIRRAMAEKGTDGKYLARLRELARQLKIPFPEDARAPMLVAYLPEGMARDAKLEQAKKGNLKTTRSVDTGQRAAADATILNTEEGRRALAMLPDSDSDRIVTEGNAAFVNAAYRILSKEDGDLVDGYPTDKFNERLENAMLSLLFSGMDEAARTRLVSDLVNNARNLGLADFKSALAVKAAKLNQVALKSREFDIRPELAHAVSDIVKWKRSGMRHASEYANQLSFDPADNMPDDRKPMFLALGNASQVSAKAVRNVLDAYLDGARGELQGQTLIGEKVTKKSLMARMSEASSEIMRGRKYSLGEDMAAGDSMEEETNRLDKILETLGVSRKWEKSKGLPRNYMAPNDTSIYFSEIEKYVPRNGLSNLDYAENTARDIACSKTKLYCGGIGEYIGFTKASAGKIAASFQASHVPSYVYATAVKNIPALIEKAELCSSHSDYKHGNRNTLQIHRLYTAFVLNKHTYAAKITVKEQTNPNGLFLYTLQPESIEIENIETQKSPNLDGNPSRPGSLESEGKKPADIQCLQFKFIFDKFKPYEDFIKENKTRVKDSVASAHDAGYDASSGRPATTEADGIIIVEPHDGKSNEVDGEFLESSENKRDKHPIGKDGLKDEAKANGIDLDKEDAEFRDVFSRYYGTPMWMKAPNGKETNLDARQWVKVRTPSFKRMFGDWESVSYAKPEIDVRSYKQGREILLKISGKDLESHDGLHAILSHAGIDKIFSGKAVDKSISPHAHIVAAANIEKLYRNSRELTAPENGNRPGIRYMHRLYAPFLFDGKPLLVKISVKEFTAGETNKLYTIEALEIEKPAGNLVPEHSETEMDTPAQAVKTFEGNMREQNSPSASNVNKVHQYMQKFKESAEKLEQKTDSNGEPIAGSLEADSMDSVNRTSGDGGSIHPMEFENGDENVRYSLREDDPPRKTGIGYKVFFVKDGKLYPPMIANPGGADTPVGVWLDADAAPVVSESRTGRPKVKSGGAGTQGGGGTLAFRPGWHLGEIPYALQFNRGEKVPNPLGVKNEKGEAIKVGRYFPKDFAWAEVEYAMDNDYQVEAERNGYNENGKYRHAYAGLHRVPVDGYYKYRTNANTATDPWIITGAMKVNRILTKEEVDALVEKAGRTPQEIEPEKAAPVRHSLTDAEETAREHSVNALQDIADGKEYGVLHNEKYGEIKYPKGSLGKGGMGFLHIIEQRMRKEGASLEEAIDTALSVGMAAENGVETASKMNTRWLDYNDIRAIIALTEKGNSIITGYEIKKADGTLTAYPALQSPQSQPLAREDEIVAALKDKLMRERTESRVSDEERRKSLEIINERFNEELERQKDGTLPEGHVYQLGRPGRILLSAGIPDLPIELSSSRLMKKATTPWHPFDLSDVKNLPDSIEHPLAVFSYGDPLKAQNIIVELTKDGKNFVVGLSLNYDRNNIRVNAIRGLFPKDTNKWLAWIQQGKALYLDKQKIQGIIAQQRTNFADVGYLDLDHVTKIINDFRNANESSENIEEKIRHSLLQTNPIVGDGKVRADYQELLDNGEYTPEDVAQWEAAAIRWIRQVGGVENAIGLVVDGLEPSGKIGTMARRLVMESDAFKALPEEDRMKVDMRHILQGREWGREGVARRLASMTLDSVAKIRRFMDAWRSRLTPAQKGRMREAVLRDTGIDIDALPDDIHRDKARLDRMLTAALASNATMKDKLYEYWVNAILSAPMTHVANTVGNLANFAYELGFKRLAEAAVNHFAGRADAARLSDFRTMWKAVDWRGAWKSAVQAFDIETLDAGGKYMEGAAPAIGGRAGRTIRMPGRFLRAADEFAKAIIVPVETSVMADRLGRQRGLEGAALDEFVKRQIASDTSESAAFARRRALELTFQEDPGGVVRMLSAMKNDRDSKWGAVLKYLFPFMKTPYNLLRQGIRKSPLGIVSLLGEAYDIARGNREFDQEAVSHAAEQLLAWGLVGLALAMGGGDDDGEPPRLTGSSSGGTPGERMFKGRHVPAYSIRIGDTYYSYRRIEPLSTILALVADGLDAYRTAKTDEGATKALRRLFTGTARMIGEKSYLNTLSQIVQIVDEPDRFLGPWMTNFAASWMPNAVRQASSAFDDYRRDSSVRSSGVQWWKDQFHVALGKAGVVRLAPKVDCFGRPITKDEAAEAGPGDIFWRLLVPVDTKAADSMDPAEKTIWNWNARHPDDQYWPSMASPRFSVDGVEYEMTGKDYSDFAIEAGRLAHRRILEMTSTGRVKPNRPTEDDIALFRKIFTASRRQTREKYVRLRRCRKAGRA